MTDSITGAIELELSVGSFNMQAKGFSKENHPKKSYSNNAYNIDESQDGYYYRKWSQIWMLSAKIYSGEDVILLQEPDFLLTENFLHDEFKKMLAYYSFELITTKKPDGPCGQQLMALIYNSKKLKIRGESQGIFSTLINGHPKFRGYESTFIYLSSDKLVTITNMHLLYGHSYDDEIETYLIEKEKKGHLHIMGGDMNGLLKMTPYTKLCSWNIATHFSADPSGRLSIYEDVDGAIFKEYDRFLAIGPETHSLFANLSVRCHCVVVDNQENVTFPFVRLAPNTQDLARWNQRFHFFKQASKPLKEPQDHSLAVLNKLEEFLERISSCDSIENLNTEIETITTTAEFLSLNELGPTAKHLTQWIQIKPYITFFELCEHKKSELTRAQSPALSS